MGQGGGGSGCIYTSSGNKSPAPAPRVSSMIVSTPVERMVCCPGILSYHSICGLPGTVWLGWADLCWFPDKSQASDGGGSLGLGPCQVCVHPWMGTMPSGLGLSSCWAGAA